MAARNNDLEKIIQLFLDEIKRTYRLDCAYLLQSSSSWSILGLRQKNSSAKPHSGENLYRIEGTIHGNSGY